MQTQKILRWGNSLAVRLPLPFARSARLEEGASVEITLERDRIVISRAPEPGPSLDDLVSRVTPENLHGETHTGGQVGNEQW